MNIIGEVKLWAGDFEPAGWTICDGKTLKVVEFPELFIVIGYSFTDSERTRGDTDLFMVPRMDSVFPINIDAIQGGSLQYIICYEGRMSLEKRAEAVRKAAIGATALTKINSAYVDKYTPSKFKNREA